MGTFAQVLRLGVSARPTHLNGQPGLSFVDHVGRIGAVMSLEITDGVVQTIRGVTNPDKLAHLGPVADARALLRQGERSASRNRPSDTESARSLAATISSSRS